MNKSAKTKSELIDELTKLQRKVKRLEKKISTQKNYSGKSSKDKNENLEKSFHEKEQNYKILIESSQDAIYVFQDEKFVLVNPAWEKLFGYTKEELSSNNFNYMDVIAPSSKEIIKNRFMARDLNLPLAPRYELQGKTKDGRIIDIEVNVSEIYWNNRKAIQGIYRDITDRKKTEEALLESENKFRKISENSLVGIYLIQDGIFKYVNPRLAEIFGYTTEELTNKMGPIDVTPLDSFKKVENNISKRLAGLTESMHYEFQGLTKNNKIIDVEVYGSRTTYLGKLAVIGTLLDITERKQHENILQDSKKKFEDLAELLPQTVFEIDLHGKITFANKSGFHIFKYSKEDFEKGISVFQILIPSEHKKAAENLQRVLRQEKIEEKEYIALKKDGKTFPALVFTSPIFQDNVPVGWRGILIDISDRKQIEEELRKLSRAVEQSPSTIMITNIFGDLEYVNPRFTELTGYEAKEVIGRNPRFLKTGHTSPNEYKDLWDLLANGKKWRGEFHNKKKSGELFWESASISPILDANGKITHFLAIKEDITEKKKIEKELIKAKEKAEESDKLKSEFLAQMSHEIRSPINVILSYNSFLRDELDGKLESYLESSFTSIDSAGKRLLRTIDLILNMAALQSGYIEFQLSQVDLSANISGLIKEFEYSAKMKNLELSFEKRTQKAEVIADEYLVSEIFQNLIGNAIKYTDEGKVTVEIYECDENSICIDVKDSGIGISDEYLPKLFLPFSQEETGYSRKFEGNGLGLALVKKYIELINAEIKVKSGKGIGSVFTVIFKSSI
ncbi:MAG: PAS domain S-box protein [Bacteroidetes bacterium]|nr:PAS domain S-box protein [Bacteroidota bacterium]